ncbi:hypothetical protein FOZ60_001485 [Perkinsus olseni]|uniref:Uncharacterized protein n=1 Tax=Perkinsus olseni TaxID=32597 RepID=A0A7J6P196_PEROL|nr:hypothetical protein FOZ60_001485 [Perkinsus olseni]
MPPSSSSITESEGEVEEEALYLVIQRISGGRLLVDEDSDTWINLHNQPGLVNYVAFGRRKVGSRSIHTNGGKNTLTSSSSEEEEGKSSSSAATPVSPLTKDRMMKAAKSLLTCKLATASGWHADHSDAESLVTLSSTTMASLVTIPQASLVGKCIPGDKYMKYHHQLDKDRSEELYGQWVTILHHEALKLINPKKYDDKNKRGMEKYLRRAEEALIDPKEMFKTGVYQGKYSAFNEGGFPLLLADGSDIPKSQVKKLTKIFNAQERKWKAAEKEGKDSNNKGHHINEDSTEVISKNHVREERRPSATTVDSEIIVDEGDLGRLHMANGTFGGRQGWEMTSTGPFTHQLVF